MTTPTPDDALREVEVAIAAADMIQGHPWTEGARDDARHLCFVAIAKHADRIRLALDTLARVEAAVVVGYAPFGDGGYGTAVPLLHHAGMTVADVKRSVAEVAAREGFHGAVDERLAMLGWDIRPLSASTDLGGKRVRLVLEGEG